MGEGSKIEWTDHTWNAWIGCEAISPACKFCYAETQAKFRGWAQWGSEKAGGTRKVMSASYWKLPAKWNREAQAAGKPARVFCSSLADVFEDFPGLDEQRARLWPVIESTPWLRWLLLTKRPQNIHRMTPAHWHTTRTSLPANIWLGATAEDQKHLDERMPWLLAHPATVHFVSCEPLLGPLDLTWWLPHPSAADIPWVAGRDDAGEPRLGWVIAGGESGPRARPSHPDWYRALRDQCAAARVPYFFKQHGELVATSQWPAGVEAPSGRRRRVWLVRDGRSEVQQTLLTAPASLDATEAELLFAMGKARTGRHLDGRAWDEVPPL